MAQYAELLVTKFLIQQIQVGLKEKVPILDLGSRVVIRQSTFEIFDQGGKTHPDAVQLHPVDASDHVIKWAAGLLTDDKTAAQVHFKSTRHGVLGKEIGVSQKP